MKRNMMTCILSLCMILCGSSAGAAEIGGILKSTYEKPGVAESFKVGGAWYPYPAYSDRDGWNKLIPKKLREDFIKKAEKRLKYKWQHIPASTFIALNSSGDKQAMRKIEGENRQAIIDLMAGELAEGEGRFLQQLADGMWFYATSFHWSHSNQTHGQLPRYDKEKIALGSARYGATLPVIYHLFKEEFDKLEPAICEEFRKTVKRILLDPYLDQEQDEANWWLGFDDKHVNNWNPWCNHGVLLAFLLVEQDQERLDMAVAKSVRSVDEYLLDYTADGACDEGATYWGQSVSRFCEYLQLMRDATGGVFEILPNEFVQTMGEYRSRATVGRNPNTGKTLSVNFGDGNYTGGINVMMLWKTGMMYDSRELKDLALYGSGDFKKKKFTLPKAASDEGYRLMENIRSYKLFSSAINKLNDRIKNGTSFEDVMRSLRANVPPYTWYPVTQQAFIHTKDGCFIGAKAGNNGETHGHNDVGNFIIYMDNVAMIVDAGVGTYVKDTFGPNRYKIWSMQSDWHNCPMPNGVSQKNGQSYAASDVSFTQEKKQCTMIQDISGAYTDDAACDSWVRTITTNNSASGSSFEIRDDYKLSERKAADKEHFMTPGEVRVSGNTATITNEGIIMHMSWSENLEISVERKDIKDKRLGRQWNNVLNRICLKSADDAPLEGTYTIKFYR